MSPSAPESGKPTIGIGMVGYAFMGGSHSQAWRTVNNFFDVGLRAKMAAICGRNEANVSAAATKFGWASYETDWRALVARDDIGLVDVASPGNNHAEVAIAALEAGKIVATANKETLVAGGHLVMPLARRLAAEAGGDDLARRQQGLPACRFFAAAGSQGRLRS